jgi:hypothetical protein
LEIEKISSIIIMIMIQFNGLKTQKTDISMKRNRFGNSNNFQNSYIERKPQEKTNG